MKRNTIAKFLTGFGVFLVVVLYGVTTSSSFEQDMLSMSTESSSAYSVGMVAVLGGAVVSLLGAKVLYVKDS